MLESAGAPGSRAKIYTERKLQGRRNLQERYHFQPVGWPLLIILNREHSSPVVRLRVKFCRRSARWTQNFAGYQLPLIQWPGTIAILDHATISLVTSLFRDVIEMGLEFVAFSFFLFGLLILYRWGRSNCIQQTIVIRFNLRGITHIPPLCFFFWILSIFSCF